MGFLRFTQTVTPTTNPNAGQDYLYIKSDDKYYGMKSDGTEFLIGGEPNAIHDNVAGEFAAITEKTVLVGGDLFLLEDSEAANAKKYATLTNMKTFLGDNLGNHTATTNLLMQQFDVTNVRRMTIEQGTSNSIYMGNNSGPVSTSNSVARNVCIGQDTGGAFTASPNALDNIAIGYRALASGTDPFGNIAIGTQVLEDNVTGDTNTGIGYQALLQCTSAANTALGAFAGDAILGGTDNCAIGWESLTQVNSGNLNTGCGAKSGWFIDTGSRNTCIGAESNFTFGEQVTTGSDNTLIGYGTGVTSTAASKRICIGANAISDTDNVCAVGSSGTDAVAIDVYAMAAPANPAASVRRIFTDSGTGKLSVRTSGGSTVSLEESGGAGTDTTAIHDDTASEISAITLKASPVSGDFLIIEDSAAGNVKKSITIGSLPGSASLPVVDTTSIAEGSVDNTKEVRFEVDGNSTGVIGVLATAFTTAKTVTFPDATDTLVGKATTDTLTNKTINADGTGNVITNIGSSEVKSELITGQTTVSAASGDFVLISDTSDTGNLKKVDALDFLGGASPPFSDSLSIVEGSVDNTKQLRFEVDGQTTAITGVVATTFTTAKTLTLPDATDTLVGKATTDTLTNKTIDADGTGNVITNIGSSEIKSEMITGQATVTAVSGDFILISDTSDTGNLKKVDALDFLGGASPPFSDSLSIVEGSVDNTKELRFEVDGNTTGIVGVVATIFTTAKTLTLPDATDTLVGKATTDTLTNKTIDADGTGNVITNIGDAEIQTHTTTKISTTNKALLNSNIVYTDQTNTFGDFAQIFPDNQLFIQNPAATFTYQIIGAAIAANRTLTLPLLTGNDTAVTEAFAQTLTNKTIDADNNTISNLAIGAEVSGSTVAGTTLYVQGTGATGFIDLDEITTPANPAANVGRLYVKDDTAVTKLYFRDSAGTETNLLAGGSGTPGGSDTQIQYNNGGAFGGIASFTYVDTTDLFTLNPTVDESTGNEVAFTINPTVNKAAGNFDAVVINVVDLGSSGTLNLLDLQVGALSKFLVDENGLVTTNTVKADTIEVINAGAGSNVTLSSNSVLTKLDVTGQLEISSNLILTAASAPLVVNDNDLFAVPAGAGDSFSIFSDIAVVDDTGSVAAVRIVPRRDTPAALVTKPLFQLVNHTTDVLSVAADGTVDFKNNGLQNVSAISPTLLNSVAIADYVVTSKSNQFGAFDQFFPDTTLNVDNPAGTFSYFFKSSAIVADRQITLPILTADDVLVFEAFSQTLTNKTINADNNTISNLAIGSEVSGSTVAGTTLYVQGTGATGFIDLDEITTPANPAANVGRLYVKDAATVTTLYFRDSAGTETDLLAGGGAHALLSATHTDTTAAAVSRGSLIVGQTATPVWQELVIGGSNAVLASDGTDATWTTLAKAHLPTAIAYEDESNTFTNAAQLISPTNATVVVTLDANHTTAADGNIIAQLDFKDTTTVAPAEQTFGQIRVLVQDPANATFEAEMFLAVGQGGALTDYIALNEAGDDQVTVKKPLDIGANDIVATLASNVVLKDNASNTYAAGSLQLFNTSGTEASTRWIGGASDPSAPLEGDFWYNKTSDLFKYFDTATRTIVATDVAQTLTNKTIDADGTGNVITNIGSSEIKSEIITGFATVTAASGDFVLISDTGDSGNLKKVDAADFLAGSGNTLDAAYDQGGAGAGRTITADSNAVLITASALGGDDLLDVDHTASGTLTANSTTTVTVIADREHTAATSITDDFDVAEIRRRNVSNNASATLTANGSVLRLISERVATLGTSTFNAALLELEHDSDVATAAPALTYRLTGDTNPRFNIDRDNTWTWGPGNAATDTTLSRTAAGVLDLADILDVNTGLRVAGAAATGNYLRGNGTNFVSAAIAAGDLPSTVVLTDQVNTYTAGNTQNFVGGAADAPINIGELSANPSVLSNGDMWITTGGLLRYQGNGQTKLVVVTTVATTYAIGAKQTFSASSTTAGIAINNQVPSGTVAGDIWRATDAITYRNNAGTADLVIVTRTTSETLTNKTLTTPAIAGSTITGVNDAGGATSFEIPNGAGGTTVDAAGEVTVDTTQGTRGSGTINFHDGTAERVLSPMLSKAITIETPTSSEDISMFFSNTAITVREMRAVVRGTTPSVTWTIRHGTDRSAAGAEVVTGGTATTSQSTGSDVTAFNDETIVADSFVWLETTAQTGTVDELNVTVFYTVDP